MAKPIQDLLSFESRDTLVLYNDGTCESLEIAIDKRKEDRNNGIPTNKAIVDAATTTIVKAAYFKTANDHILLTYFTKSRKNDDIHLVFFKLDSESLQLVGPVNKVKLLRDGRSAELSGYTVVDGIMWPHLVTICE